MSQTKGVKLGDTTQQRLAALGRIRDGSPHWLMCRAIETYLDREEKYEQEKREDMERWEQYQLTGVAVPHEQAAEWLENLAQGKVGIRIIECLEIFDIVFHLSTISSAQNCYAEADD
ncbi:MAG: toxin-antitoxin system [Chlorobium sp.]